MTDTDAEQKARVQEYFSRTAESYVTSASHHALERFILESSASIQHHFEIKRRSDGHLESFIGDAILLKGRKN